jgi:hypothetical protein
MKDHRASLHLRQFGLSLAEVKIPEKPWGRRTQALPPPGLILFCSHMQYLNFNACN